uniref:CCHC-type domain-containing protein n=1 Tax=Tanacetum cinerariifolium TaxID=118510 RepID=A0A6L2MLZ7_TANCI|nr:hypothetical protein [Tanacetum cinerariifolium]
MSFATWLHHVDPICYPTQGGEEGSWFCLISLLDDSRYTIGIKSLLDAIGITAAQVYVNTAQLELVLLVNFNEKYSKCLPLLVEVKTSITNVNVVEEVNIDGENILSNDRLCTMESHREWCNLAKTQVMEGVMTEMPIIYAEEKAQIILEVKARRTLMMGIPNENQLNFNSIRDAKKLLEAREKRFGEKLLQEVINKKLLRSLSPEWNTHVVVWRNKADLDTVCMDDVYNNLKVCEPEVKRMSSSNSSTQNMAFVSSSNNNSNSTNEAVNTTHGVSTASTQVNAAYIDNFSDVVICSFFASQPSCPQLVHKDLEQIHPDDMEEMDLRWQMAMLTIRDRRFLKKTRKKLTVNGLQREHAKCLRLLVKDLMLPSQIDVRLARKNELKARGTLLMALPDKHQLKFNIHKDAKTLMEAIKKRFGGNKETKKVQKTLLKQQYENFTGSSSESLDQIYDRLQKLISQLEILRESLSQEDINLKFLRSLPTEWRTHTLIWRNKTNLEEQSLDDLFNNLKIYEAEVKSSSSASTSTQNIVFVSSSNTNSTNEPVSATVSVSVVSAKIPVSALPNVDTLRFDMSKVECYNCHRKGHFARECRSPKDIRRNGAAEPQRRNVPAETSTLNLVETSIPAANPKTTIPKPKSQGNSRNRKACFVFNAAAPKPHVAKPRPTKSIVTKPHSPHRRHINHNPSPKASNFPPKVTAAKASMVNVVTVVQGKWEWKPKCLILDHISHIISASMTLKRFDYNDALRRSKSDKGVIYSRCSWHMIRNMSYLSNFKELNGGYVAFGGNPKGGKISGKGKIRTGKLNFDDVYFVKELKFNLFSVSQMCDKKNSAYFTDTKCLVLSPKFKLPDENQVLLRVPMENNMYNVDLKNIVPSGDLTCLFAKETLDESNLWHRRLGHINFKTINKLVKEKVGEENIQQYVLFPVWSSGSTNPQNTDGDAAFEVKEPEFEGRKPQSKVHVSLSSSAQSKKHDDKSKREAKGKSPVDDVGPLNTVVSPTHGKSSHIDTSQYLDDPNMPELEDITYSNDEEDVGAEADFTNLETSITVSPIPTTKVHKDHHVTQIIGDLSLATQKMSISRVAEDQGGLSQINNDDFHTSMQEELLQFKMQKVWVLVDFPYGKKAIGHTQEEGIDYEEVFAPVVRIEAIRLFLAYASFMGFMVYQIDVKSAFLYGTIEEEVYVCQPLGFEDPDYPDKVYKVVKALYGLDQAPRAWYETLANYLLKNDFQRGKIDQTLFIKRQKVDIMLVQIYVDDIIFGSTNKDLCKAFEKLMNDKFQISSMGELTFFLVLQVNDVLRLQALVDKRNVIIMEATIRDALRLADAEGIDCLPNKEIFTELARMGHIDESATEVNVNDVPAASGADEGAAKVNVDVVPVDVDEPSIPLPTPPTQPPPPSQDIPSTSQDVEILMDLLYNLLNTCTTRTRIVEHLEQDRIAQALEITKLKQRVKKLERRNKLKDIAKDVAVIAETKESADVQGRQARSQAQIYQINLEHDDKVMSMQDDEEDPKEKGVVIRDPKETATPSTIIHSEAKSKDKRKGIMDEVIDQVQRKEKEDNAVKRYQALKRKPQTEAQARKNMTIYLRNKTKEHIEEEDSITLKRISETQEDKAAKKQKLDEEVPVVDYKIYTENNKPYYKIIRADGSPQLFLSFLSLLRNFDREDLEVLWELVKERFASSKPKNFSNDFLLTTLTYMLKKPDVQAQVWKNQRTVHGLAKESTRKSMPVETTTSKALVSCDVLDKYDWSDQVEEETVNHLKYENEQLLKDLKKSELMVLGYKTGLKSVEERLEFFKTNESIYLEDIKVLKVEIQMKDIAIRKLRKKLEIAQKEKDGI